jgi:hypothetical protein
MLRTRRIPAVVKQLQREGSAGVVPDLGEKHAEEVVAGSVVLEEAQARPEAREP